MAQDIDQIKGWVSQLVGAVTRTALPLDQHQAAIQIGNNIIKASGGEPDTLQMTPPAEGESNPE